MKTLHIFAIFIAVAIAQLVVPTSMILNLENTLNEGTLYKFKTQPIDPTDPFRGKYITLNYEINSFKTTDTTWQRKDAIYIYLKKDSLGFAEISKVSKEELNVEEDHIFTTVSYYYKHQNRVNFTLPFNRFYMEESKAQPAEDAFRNAQRDSLPNNTYAKVYIKDGDAVLEDVLINDIPIATYVEQQDEQ